MNFRDAMEAIRQRISCTMFLQKSKGNQYVCPYCKSGTGPNGSGALTVYKTNTFYCFACKKSGDPLDLYMQITGAQFVDALEALAAQAGITEPITYDGQAPAIRTAPRAADQAPTVEGGHSWSQEPARDKSHLNGKQAQEEADAPRANFSGYYIQCRKNLIESQEAQAYLEKRGISLDLALKYFVGFDPAWISPTAIRRQEEKGSSWRPPAKPVIILPSTVEHYFARDIRPEEDMSEADRIYKKMNEGTPVGIFGAHLAFETENPPEIVFVVEGAFDALAIMEAAPGSAAIALNSTDNADNLLKQLEEHPTKATLIICQDNDDAGRKATRVLRDGLNRLNITNEIVNISGDCKDPNEALTTNRAAFAATLEKVIAAFRPRTPEQLEAERKRAGEGMVDSFLTAIQSRRYEPVPTGITDIDQAIGGGFIRQQLVLMGAAPRVGKTAITQWIFEGMAKRGETCIFVNLEMSREQILARSFSRMAARNGHKISATTILQGYRWTDEQRAAILEAATEYKATIAPRMIYNPDGIGKDLDGILTYIEDEARAAETAGQPAPFVVLDYLQIITGRKGEDAAELIKRIVGELKDFAVRHNTVVFVIMAHNRRSNESGDVTMESGRDTSAIEYSADLQLALTYTHSLKRSMQVQKKPDDLTDEERKEVTLRITKNRFGGTGREVDLFFDGETMTLTQTAKAYQASTMKGFTAGGKRK